MGVRASEIDSWRLMIWQARLVIADVTEKNPNVNYELESSHCPHPRTSSSVLIEDLGGQRDTNYLVGLPARGQIYRLQQKIRAY